MRYGLDIKVEQIDEHLLDKLSQFQLQKRIAFGTKKFRSSKISWINDESIRKDFLNIAQKVNVDAKWFLNIFYCEPLQMTFYDEGDYYCWHIDQGLPNLYPDSNFYGCRKISMTLFLSDPEEYDGGEFDLEIGRPLMEGEEDKYERVQSYKGKKGTAIFFKSDYWHQVRPIKSGNRKSLVAWFAGSPYV